MVTTTLNKSNFLNILIKDNTNFIAANGVPDFHGIQSRIESHFNAGNSSVYFARPIEEIVETRRLDGCQDWGLLWTWVLKEIGVSNSYIQGVDILWLKEYGLKWNGEGWRGHVFFQADLPYGKTAFCSTTARVVRREVDSEGRKIIDDRFVVLFEGSGPGEFNACTQEGIRVLLKSLINDWR